MNRKLETHLDVLAALLIGLGVLGLIGIVVLLVVFSIGSVAIGFARAQDPTVPGIVALIPVVIGLFFATLVAVTTIPNFIAAYGLLKRRPWGPLVALVASILNLPHIPLGTGVGIYGIWVYLQLDQGRPPAAGAPPPLPEPPR
ncbi:MAG: hypothetical protein WAO20_02285 [Acidobacteriota bacterium]